MGTATAVVKDDPSSTSAYRGTTPGYTTKEAGTFSGTLTADAEVEISADGEAWIDLGSPANMSLDMQSSGDETTVHSNVAIPVGTYTRVRLRLSGGEANIDAGASLGGIVLSAAVSILVGGSDQDVVIEKTVAPFTVTADSNVRLVFDLNSEVWVNQSNADDETAEDQEVEDAADADREVTEQD